MDTVSVRQSEHHHDAGSVPAYRPWLHRFAMLTVTVTFGLVVLGGTVTSKGVGLAVPDWPTTFDYNMFLFPPSMWKGGVFWEHTHRLLGSVVGMMSIVVAVWLWVTQVGRSWLRWLGVAALVMVIVQGVMGGLRVTEMDYRWGVLHGVLAQVFLAVTVVIAAVTSRIWIEMARLRETGGGDPNASYHRCGRGLRVLSLATLAVVLMQLILGATMRHSGSGLAIPDFPSAYGGIVPPMSTQAIHEAIDALPYEQVTSYYTPVQVWLHFAHRVWAVAVVGVIVWLVTRLCLDTPDLPVLRGPATALVGLVMSQVALGALVIWSGRHPEVATAHQAIGAAILGVVTLLVLRIHVLMWPGQGEASVGDTESGPYLSGSINGAAV